MSNSPTLPDSFEQLVASAIDRTLTPADRARLGRLVADDPAAREYYLDYLATHAVLQWSHETLPALNLPTAQAGGASAPPAPPAPPESFPIYRKGHEPKSTISNFKFSIFNLQFQLIAAALLAACGVAIYVFVSSLPRSEFPDPTSPASLATLIESSPGSNLTTPGGFISEGRDYPRGEYTLDAGSAQFLLTNRVGVHLHGPTRINMHGDMRASVSRGTAVFNCPAGTEGFTVYTPGNLRIVDLGTRFRVSVDDHGAVTCRVIDGRVRIENTDPEAHDFVPHELVAGHAVRWADEKLTPVPAIELALAEPRFAGNLIVNGDFESGPTTFTTDPPKTIDVAIDGWHDETRATVVTYESGLRNNYPNPRMTTLPDNPGERYFLGLYEGRITQDIELDDLADTIDVGLVRYELAAWLGGYYTQADSPQLTAHFRGDDGETLATATLGPVTADDRGNRTGFVRRETADTVPPGTRTVHLELRGIAGSGAVDAYADNLSLTLHPAAPAEPIAETPIPR